MRRPQRLVSHQTLDATNASIYMASIDRLHVLPPKLALPSLGIRWLCERHGYEKILKILRGPQGANVPDAVIYEIRYCVSWMADRLVRDPPKLEALPAIWDDIKTLHVGSYDPEVMDRVIRILARIRKRADTLDARSRTEH